ncbi:hypothetical protein N8993_14505 [Pseudomonadales bacterium]|jgi:hypothetical protein|nr:hypothetical protein [Gammaproteobacteria bacterium]MDA7755458.1 hypothetical protein [Pseudomonadales bacterium]MDC3220807.1 hypothetical protein [bacterium]MDA7775380.1 hypothetical protein [Pseudomonadales bacterium]MDC0995424.1 hypothetical protein [Pseudomonadales bacterium]|tara:strand:+ start:8366 stop:8539 length:174 start_codon:yes stop_codon:yes gene_type:complete
MISKAILGTLKFVFVDSTVNILGDLFEQPLIMWAFIGWGWLSMLAMITGLLTQIPNL